MQHPNVVALIANGPYLPGAFVTAASILRSGLRQDASIIILHPAGAVSGDRGEWLERAYPRIELLEVDATAFLPRELSSWDTVLAPLFLRFALAEVLSCARRILYVDSDILALRSVDDAFDFDLRNKSVAAAHDDLVAGLIGYKPSWISYREALGVPAGTPYLNCGVLLMDANAWRQHGIKQALTETYLSNRALCRHYDQSTINLFLKGDFAPLSPAWNFQQNYQAIGAEDIVNPRLVHFAGSSKPWRSDGFVFDYTYRRRYRELLAATPFKRFFESYWRINRRQAKEAWRSVNRILRGREAQSGIKRSDIELLRADLAQLLSSRNFIDLPSTPEVNVGTSGASRPTLT